MTGYFKWPHVKEATLNLWADDVANGLDLEAFGPAHTSIVQQRIGRYLFQPAIVGNPPTRPYPLSRFSLPVACDSMTFSVLCASGTACNFELAQIVEP